MNPPTMLPSHPHHPFASSLSSTASSSSSSSVSAITTRSSTDTNDDDDDGDGSDNNSNTPNDPAPPRPTSPPWLTTPPTPRRPQPMTQEMRALVAMQRTRERVDTLSDAAAMRLQVAQVAGSSNIKHGNSGSNVDGVAGADAQQSYAVYQHQETRQYRELERIGGRYGLGHGGVTQLNDRTVLMPNGGTGLAARAVGRPVGGVAGVGGGDGERAKKKAKRGADEDDDAAAGPSA